MSSDNNTEREIVSVEELSGDAGPYGIQALHSDMVLDVRGESTQAGAEIIQWWYHGRDNQQFYLEDLGNRVHHIRSKKSGLLLEVWQSSTVPGEKIIQWQQHPGVVNNQRWLLEYFGNFAGWIITNLNSGLVLDVRQESTQPGAEIIQWNRHGGLNQRFRIFRI